MPVEHHEVIETSPKAWKAFILAIIRVVHIKHRAHIGLPVIEGLLLPKTMLMTEAYFSLYENTFTEPPTP